MLDLLDPDEIRRNIRLFVDVVRPDPQRQEVPRALYFAALNDVQPRPFRLPGKDRDPHLDFEALHPVNRPIAQQFLRTDEVSEEHLFSREEQTEIRAGTRAAFDLLNRHQERVVEAIRLLVACLLCVKQSGAGGGSFGDSLGVVWFDPSPSWEPADYAETVLHEATHQGVFLCDMVQRLFVREPGEMSSDDALVISAIRAARRPYDLAFHSACVAAALADFHARTGRRERSRELLQALRPTADELRNKSGFLTQAGLAILEELEQSARPLPISVLGKA